MEKYEVKIRHVRDGSRWSMFFDADDFGHAEEQANDHIDDDDEVIVIEKDYENHAIYS